MGIPSGQRKQVYVNRSIQGTVMKRFAVYWLGYHLTLWHSMLLYGYFRGLMLRSDPNGGMGFWQYYGKFFEANHTVLLCCVAVCPLLLWDTLRVTHRIAGPIVRFKKALKQLSRGEYVGPIQLREHDLMDDLKDAFNEFLASRERADQLASGHLSSTEVVALDNILAQMRSESSTKCESPFQVASK